MSQLYTMDSGAPLSKADSIAAAITAWALTEPPEFEGNVCNVTIVDPYARIAPLRTPQLKVNAMFIFKPIEDAMGRTVVLGAPNTDIQFHVHRHTNKRASPHDTDGRTNAKRLLLLEDEDTKE